jgi:hypothetical protein
MGKKAGLAAILAMGSSGELPFGQERHISMAAQREMQQLQLDMAVVRNLA